MKTGGGGYRRPDPADSDSGARMPLAVTIETAYGAVGLVHADVPHADRAVATTMLKAGAPGHVDIALLGVDAPEDGIRSVRCAALVDDWSPATLTNTIAATAPRTIPPNASAIHFTIVDVTLRIWLRDGRKSYVFARDGVSVPALRRTPSPRGSWASRFAWCAAAPHLKCCTNRDRYCRWPDVFSWDAGSGYAQNRRESDQMIRLRQNSSRQERA